MTEAKIFEQVAAELTERIKVDKDLITMDASLTGVLELDSLDLMELVMALEERFKLQIPDEEAGKLQTVGDVVKFLAAWPLTSVPPTPTS